MSSGHCAQCGAMSTLWLPTCVFCGGAVSGSGVRTRSVLDVALSEPAKGRRTCTSRGVRERAAFRSWWARLFQRLAAMGR